jgi:hypothetical protein
MLEMMLGLYIAATIDASVLDERIFASAKPFN